MKIQPSAKQSPARKKSKPLNSRQERFCEFVAAGMNQTEAYIKAGFKTTKDAARANAARMIANDNISRRINELRAATEDIQIAKMKKQEKLDFLAQVIRTPIGHLTPGSPYCAEHSTEILPGSAGIVRQRVKAFDKLRAIELHSKLMGHFEPDRTEIDCGNQALMKIRERADELGYALGKAYSRGTPAKLD
jgi:phage terminase small subunit